MQYDHLESLDGHLGAALVNSGAHGGKCLSRRVDVDMMPDQWSLDWFPQGLGVTRGPGKTLENSYKQGIFPSARRIQMLSNPGHSYSN